MGARFLAAAFALLFLSAEASAQSDLALSADSIEFSKGFSVVSASGNVVMKGPGRYLQAESIVFDKLKDELAVIGPLELVAGNESVILAEFAELSPNLQEGVLRDARILLGRQFQFTTKELIKDKEKIVLRNAFGSACAICKPGETPAWSIEAGAVESGDSTERIVFRNAILRVVGIPVAYLPYLSVPGPGVNRADGLLPPELFESSIVGTGIVLPYYKTLGDHADLTLAPFYSTKGGSGLQFENRYATSAGNLGFIGSLGSGQTSDQDYRAWVSARGRWRLDDGVVFSHDNETVSDNTFLRDFGYSQKARIENRFALEVGDSKNRVTADLLHFRSLFDPDANRTVPYLVGRAYWNSRLENSLSGGVADFELSATALQRRQGTDRLAAAAQFGWTRSWNGSGGIEFSTEFGGTAIAYSFGGESDGSEIRAYPSASFKARWPWIKRRSSGFETLEPVAQLVWTPDSISPIDNEDSNLMELDETNLFAVNRFAGYDQWETGARLNLGLAYGRHSPGLGHLELYAGRILRQEPRQASSSALGLRSRDSDYVASFDYKAAQSFRFRSRFLADDALKLSRAEYGAETSYGDLKVDGSYTWLEYNFPIDNSAYAEFYSVNAQYALSERWNALAKWQYDGAERSSISEEIGFNYQRDCADFEVALSRRFQSSIDKQPITSIKFNFSLGLGGGNSAAASCG